MATAALAFVTILVKMVSIDTQRGNHAPESGTWSVARAKAQLSEVIERAIADGPQTITRRGRQAVVVVSADEWELKTRRQGTLADFLAASPLSGSGLHVERLNDGPREIDL